MKARQIWEIIESIFLILVLLWGCFGMIHGAHIENIYEEVAGGILWLYALLTMKLNSIEEDVRAGVTLSGIHLIRASMGETKEKENANS